MQNTDEEGKIKFARFTRQTLLRHASSDKCLKYVFQFEGARLPLIPLFRSNKDLQNIAYTFGYGEKDFFKRIHADNLI